jgi:hypothetical protein
MSQERQRPAIRASSVIDIIDIDGGGEMGALMRSLDWSRTPLGSVSGWSQSLRLAVSIMLRSRYPMFIWWGQELINLYNDAYAPMLGKRHPEALGNPPPSSGPRSGTPSARRATPCSTRGGRRGAKNDSSSWSGTATRKKPTSPTRTARCLTTVVRLAVCSAPSPRTRTGS